MDDEAVHEWLRRNAIRLNHLAAGNGFDDLQPLRRALDGITVLGLGEATHGTREFFRLKHRLVEFLVVELGFSIFALESSHAAGELLDHHVADGAGDRAEVLSAQGYLAWDTKEFSDLVDWLRHFNATVAPGQRVKFSGLDLNYNGHGRRSVLAFLRRAAPDLVPEADAVLAVLASEEAQWPLGIDEDGVAALRSVAPRLDALTVELDGRTSGRPHAARSGEAPRVLRFLEVMRQWLGWVTGDGAARSRRMGENLVHELDRGPGRKAIVWAHNVHVGVVRTDDGGPTLGAILRERYGSGYYAVGFECGTGSYRTRLMPAADRLADLTVADLPATGPRSLPRVLSGAGIGDAIFDLNAASPGSAVDRWLREPVEVHDASWLKREPDPTEVGLRGRYDAVAFVRRSTATRPTPNAVRAAARGDGL